MSKLDDIIDNTPIVHQFGCSALERSDGGMVDYTCTCGNTRKVKKQVKAQFLELIDQAIPPIPTNLESKELIDYYDGVHYARERIKKEVEDL